MNEGALHELPGGWVWTRLGEIGTINPRTNGENIEGDTEVTFLPMRCVEELTGCFDLSLTKRFSEVKKGYTPFVDGDLIFAKITPCMENGKIAIVKGLKNGMGFGSTEFHVIRLSKIIPAKYFFYYLVRQELRKDAKRNMTGTAGQLRVSTSYMQQIIFPLPPLPEQRAIVSKIEQLFSDLENGIENFKKAQAQLKLYRQSVLKAACEGKLVPTEAELARAQGHDYEAADVLLARILKERGSKYKESVARITRDLSAMPEGWCWATVEELNPANRTCAYGVLQPGNDVEIGVPLVRVGDIKEGRIFATGMKKIVPQIAEEYTRTKLEGGEVLITLVGAIGRTAIVPKSLAGANTARAVGVIPLNNNIEAAWVNIFFQQAKKIAEMTSKSHEVARKTLNLEDVRATLIALPPLAEQRRIVAEVERRLSVSDKMEGTITESLQKAESLRQSILKKAFEGKLLNKNELEKARNAPDWEPAEKLLERIKAEKVKAQKNTRRPKE